jgi:tetratricopeptide (TPR) repeat protein
VVGDHGECLMEHNEATHAFQLYDTTLHVPLVFAGPPFVRPGHRVATAVSVVDLMPTILECLSIPLPAPISGRSVKGALSGLDIESRPAYAETEAGFVAARCAPLRSVITDRWKFVETTRRELYDLANDPHERNNLFASESEQAEELKRLLEEMQSKMTAWGADAVNLSRNQIRVLESLGYFASRKKSASRATPDEPLSDVKDLLPHYNAFEQIKTSMARGAADALAEGIASLGMILAQFPQFDEARTTLAKALFDAKRFEDAARQCAILVEDEPAHADALFLWGNALAALERFDEAIPRYRQALDLQPNSAALHYYLALVLLKVGQPAEGMTELEEAIRCDTRFADAYFQLARLEDLGGMANDAIPHCEAALRLQPDHRAAAELLQRLKAGSRK